MSGRRRELPSAKVEDPPVALENCPGYGSSKDGCSLIFGLKASPPLSLLTRLAGADVAEASASPGWRTSQPQPLCSEAVPVGHSWRTEVEAWAKSLAI